jgi:hypothetical protein
VGPFSLWEKVGMRVIKIAVFILLTPTLSNRRGSSVYSQPVVFAAPERDGVCNPVTHVS